MPRRKTPDVLARKIGARVRELREEAGLTLEKLAYESELGSKGHLSDLEAGRLRPTVQSLAHLADRLGVELVDLVSAPSSIARAALVERSRFASEAEIKRALALLPEVPAAAAFRVVSPTPRQRYRSCVPLLALGVAAGAFRGADLADDIQWVVPRTRRPIGRGMFVARVMGQSMEPLVRDRTYALFRTEVRGALDGRILLVQRGGLHEGDAYGAQVTLKTFEGAARAGEGGLVRTRGGVLRPANARFAPIVLARDEEIRVIAELAAVLPDDG